MKKTKKVSKKSEKKPEKPKITKDMTLGEVIEKYSKSAEIMFKYGLHCIGCHVAAWETIEQGATMHGMDEKTLNKMLKEINDSAD